jgi:hypothetical protein
MGKVTLQISRSKYTKLRNSGRVDAMKIFDERCLYGVPVSEWEEWAIEGLSATDIENKGFSHHMVTTVRLVYFEGRYEEYQIELRKGRTLERLREGWSFEEIYTKGFKKLYNPNWNKYKMKLKDYFLETLFPGLSFEEIEYLAFMSLLPLLKL